MAGTHSIQCPQGEPAWLNLFGRPIGNLTDIPPVSVSDLPPADPSVSEDCLFLDILVPEVVISSKASKAAVLVFIHGGGFVSGSKTAFGSGIGLVEAASRNGVDLVYVAINYRLGLLGWMSAAEGLGIPPNLGLLDQRSALEWVQKNINLVGGDKSSVVVLGESAGGGSIMHHMGSSKVSWTSLFSRAIVQSPFILHQPRIQQRLTLEKILTTANATSVNDLKNMSTADLQIINGLVVGNARPYGTYAFGPVQDQDFSGFPPASISEWQNIQALTVMAGHNSKEGILFASPFVKSDPQYSNYLAQLFPDISTEALSALTEELYPNNFSGEYGYTDQFGRTEETMAGALIVCNMHSLNMAAQRHNRSFAYQFSVPPGVHASDLDYTFFDRRHPEKAVNATLAEVMQTYFANFAATGRPTKVHGGATDCRAPVFPPSLGPELQNFNATNVGRIKQSALYAKRCEWWQQGLFR